MEELNSFAQVSEKIPLIDFVIRLLWAFLLTQILNYVYVKTGYGISAKKSLGRNLPMISMTTMLIITIVKSSLALSLGLVGALSIVRFRTAIKEPEELTYIFISIAVGLGLGASQGLATTVGFLIIVGVIVYKWRFLKRPGQDCICLLVSSKNAGIKEYTNIISVIYDECDSIALQRFSLTKENLDAAFNISMISEASMVNMIARLKELQPNINVDVLETTSLGV